MRVLWRRFAACSHERVGVLPALCVLLLVVWEFEQPSLPTPSPIWEGGGVMGILGGFAAQNAYGIYENNTRYGTAGAKKRARQPSASG